MTDAEAQGVAGVASKLIGSLPAQFLMLLVLNVVFILGLLWFLNARDEARERLLTPILAACLQPVNKENTR